MPTAAQRALTALESEVEMALAGDSLPLGKRAELEQRIEAIRVNAGARKPEPLRSLRTIRDDADKRIAETARCVESTDRHLQQSVELLAQQRR